jgi:hypothetical protein
VGCEVTNNQQEIHYNPNTMMPEDNGASAFVCSTATIRSCLFTKHSSLSLLGAASTIVLRDSTVGYNTRGAGFGGLNPHSLIIDNCRFMENGIRKGVGSGYGLVLNSENVKVSNTLFAGNRGGYALSGGGSVTDCQFINNDGIVDGDRLSVINSIFCGNNSIHYYGRFWENPSCPSLRNILIVETKYSTACTLQNCVAQDNLFNTCIAQNTVFLGNSNLSSAIAQNCVFSGNPTLDAVSISGTENMISDPQFRKPRLGYWTSPPVYDAGSTQTTLTDTNTFFYPNELAGQLIKVNSTVPSSFYVLSNTVHTVTVYGHAEDKAAMWGAWMIMDYHPAAGSSPC